VRPCGRAAARSPAGTVRLPRCPPQAQSSRSACCEGGGARAPVHLRGANRPRGSPYLLELHRHGHALFRRRRRRPLRSSGPLHLRCGDSSAPTNLGTETVKVQHTGKQWGVVRASRAQRQKTTAPSCTGSVPPSRLALVSALVVLSRGRAEEVLQSCW